MTGQIISHYEILEKIGGGGMGIVYKARDMKLDRMVALKFLPPELTRDPDAKKRFIHEAKAASTLEHNNICNIHEINETEDGQLFISMAYYEGESLKHKIESERLLSIDEILDIAIQIARGLSRAHESSIIHRDLKPANIMVTMHNEIKIVDFGLAKLDAYTKVTREGISVGTVAYMSPEQTKGNEVDQRTDIWSLGVVLYEMLRGQLPFRGDYDQAVIYSIVNEQPERIENIPDNLNLIITKCLEKNPQDRYQNVSELLADLQGIKKGPAAGKRSGIGNKKLIMLSAVVSIIFILVLAGYFLLPHGKSSVSEWENSIAVLPFDNISNDPDQEYFCDGMTEQIISNLAKLPRLKVISRTSVMQYKDTDKTIPEIGRELNVAHILEGSIRKFGDRIRVTAQLITTEDDFHLWSEHYDKEYKELFDIQDNVSTLIASSLLDKLSGEETRAIKSIRSENIEAYEYYLRGKHFHYAKSVESFQKEGEEAAKSDLKTAEEMLLKSIQLDNNFADSYAALADVYNSFYYGFAKSEEEKNKNWYLQKAYLDTALLLNPNSAEAYYVMNYMHGVKAIEYFKNEEYGKYESEINEEFKCLKKAIKLDKNHENANMTLGVYLGVKGLNYASLKYINISIAVNPLDYYNLRGTNYFRLGDYEQAEVEYLKMLQIKPDHFSTLEMFSELLIALKRYDEAEHILKKREKLFPNKKTGLPGISWQSGTLTW